MKNILLLSLLLSFSFYLSGEEGCRFGVFSNPERFATTTDEMHYQQGIHALREHNHPKEAIRQLSIVAYCFPDSPLKPLAHYFLGEAYMALREFEYANTEFTNYLQTAKNAEYFMEVMKKKFAIAEAFHLGARQRLFSSKIMPKWVQNKELAIEIYDELIAALPTEELTVMALFQKGALLHEMHDFREAIESYQTLIRRFPKNEKAPECYRQMIKIYRDQAIYEFQNPDLIVLAEIQLDKFRAHFPRDEKIGEAEQDILSIKESYAQGLFEAAQFYERRSQPSASILYYRQAVEQFPGTSVAHKSRKRLFQLGYTDPASVASTPEEIPLSRS